MKKNIKHFIAQKWVKKASVVFFLFITGIFIQEATIYHEASIEREEFRITFKPPNGSQERILGNSTIKIITPDPINTNTDPNSRPVVIMVPGDTGQSNIWNFATREFVKKGYVVVQVEYLFGEWFVVLINKTIGYLESRQDVNMSQISLLGHSHGGHFSLIYAALYPDLINSVICVNPGSYSVLLGDYTRIQMAIKSDAISITNGNFSSLFSIQQPRNVLIISEITDKFFNGDENVILNLLGIDMDNLNIINGSFTEGNARKLIISDSFLGHSSGLFNENLIYEEISWFQRCNFLPLDIVNLNEIQQNIRLVILIVIFTVITGFYFGILITKTIPPSWKALDEEYLNKLDKMARRIQSFVLGTGLFLFWILIFKVSIYSWINIKITPILKVEIALSSLFLLYIANYAMELYIFPYMKKKRKESRENMEEKIEDTQRTKNKKWGDVKPFKEFKKRRQEKKKDINDQNEKKDQYKDFWQKVLINIILLLAVLLPFFYKYYIIIFFLALVNPLLYSTGYNRINITFFDSFIMSFLTVIFY